MGIAKTFICSTVLKHFLSEYLHLYESSLELGDEFISGGGVMYRVQ